MDRILDCDLRSVGDKSSDNSNVYLERKQDELDYESDTHSTRMGICDVFVDDAIKRP
jgi:hypothetical protein